MADTSLAALIDDAVEALGPDGDLPAEHRLAIYRQLRATDLRRWARLELDCAAHVLPIWLETWDDPAPADILDLARRTLGDPSLGPTLRERADRLETSLDDMDSGPDEDPAHVAGWTIRQAAWAAIEAVEPQTMERPPGDDDPWGWSAAFSGSIAWARGATWETDGRTGDPALRRDYWRWYLQTAIPAAFA